MSKDAEERLDRWLATLPEDASDEEFNEAMDRWEKGEEPPTRPS